MSTLPPKEIYKDFITKKLDKNKASELLISIIENPLELDNRNRISSVKFLGLIGSKEDNVYFFLENLLISDLNELVRGHAARIIIRNFSHQAIEPIKWALKHEKSESCIILIIKELEKTNNLKLKLLLKSIDYVDFEGNIIFPFGAYPIINLSNNNIDKISKVKGLGNLINLNKLNLNFNRITEIDCLDNLINLRHLHLQWNKIKEIKGLDHLKKLEYLYLNNNEILKIQGIRNLYNLKSLMIYDNEITEIQNLEHLSNLEILNLRNNRIHEIKGLNYLNNLKRLDLSNNSIAEIKDLDNLTSLEFLDLSYNQISEIKGLDNLKNLKFLDLRNNKITAIRQLNILKQLKHLYLGFNRISLIEYPENKSFQDTLDIEGKNFSNSPFDFFYNYTAQKNSANKKSSEMSDIKFMPELFKSQSILKELKLIRNPINYFTNSSWIITWKNNEFEIFKISKSGRITWIQRRRKRNLPS
ncbi:MAG: leucine-rich repeat domain-containing protein [Candidatus Thorarchaeota archaeon]